MSDWPSIKAKDLLLALQRMGWIVKRQRQSAPSAMRSARDRMIMPARDFLHNIVKNALIKDGWTITHDPFTIVFGTRRVYADLGAERLIAAQRNKDKIVVEIKSFVGVSIVAELERAVGQYAIYRSWLLRTDPDRTIYLALDDEAYQALFQDISGEVLLVDQDIKIIVVDATKEEVLEWRS
jgi:predicted RNA binding protein YcfA (HicA-like mRNA interferase family)